MMSRLGLLDSPELRLPLVPLDEGQNESWSDSGSRWAIAGCGCDGD